MVNVAVLNLKDIIKYMLKFLVVIIAIIAISKTYRFIGQSAHISSLERTIPAITYVNSQKEEPDITTKIEEVKNTSFIERILSSQLPMKNSIIKKQEQNETDIKLGQNDDVKTDVDTQIVQDNNIQTTFTNIYNTVEVKNTSNYQLTEDILNPNIELLNKKDILIFHTHTSESYTPSENFQYEMTGSYRTTDLNFTVSRVGDELDRLMTNRRI